MKYLVLRRFTSYGVVLHKGDVVDESQIRSPRLRVSEGKIVAVKAVADVPEEIKEIKQVVSSSEVDTGAVKEVVNAPVDASEELNKKPIFKLK